MTKASFHLTWNCYILRLVFCEDEVYERYSLRKIALSTTSYFYFFSETEIENHARNAMWNAISQLLAGFFAWICYLFFFIRTLLGTYHT